MSSTDITRFLSFCSHVLNKKQTGLLSLCSYVLNKKQTGLLSLCSYVLLFLPLCLASCGEGGCDDNGSAVPLAWFYGTGTTQRATVSNLTVNAIGAPGDTVLLNNATASELHLPLRVSSDRTQWRLTFMTTDSIFLSDTLTFAYRPIEYFASVECGAMYHFDLLQVTTTHHVIDSVSAIKPHVTHVEQVNLHIFLPITQP